MKVFQFDPQTGRKGDLIENIALASWTSQSLEYAVGENLIEPISVVVPERHNAQFTVHLDAGRTDTRTGEDHSYRHPTEWRCFCLGEVIIGTDSEWQWVILPPANAIVKTGDTT